MLCWPLLDIVVLFLLSCFFTVYILFFVYYVSSSFTWQLKTLNFDIIGHGQVMNIICSTQECYRVNCYMCFSWKAASCSVCYGSQLLWQWREVVILFLRNISVTLVTCWSLYYLQTVPHHVENTSYLSASIPVWTHFSLSSKNAKRVIFSKGKETEGMCKWLKWLSVKMKFFEWQSRRLKKDRI